MNGRLHNIVIGGPGSRPTQPTIDFLKDFSVDEPSAVDQLAAIQDPDGEAAQKVKDWKAWRTKVRRFAVQPMRPEFVETVTVENL